MAYHYFQMIGQFLTDNLFFTKVGIFDYWENEITGKNVVRS